jgi:thiol-disulfide isomerase/thioredoxin
VGQELRYRAFEASWDDGKPVARDADGVPKSANLVNLVLYVVGKDPDGSFRVVTVVSEKFRSSLFTATLLPDGRTTPLERYPWITLRTIFPLLPADALQRRKGWQERIDDEVTIKYSCDGREIRSDVEYSGYPRSRSVRTYRLRADNGIPDLIGEEGTGDAVDRAAPKERRIRVEKTEGRIELQGFEQHPPDWAEKMNADLRRFEAANNEFRRSRTCNQVPLGEAARNPAALAAFLDKRRAGLAAAIQKIADANIRSVLQSSLKLFDKYRAFDEESAGKLAKLANLPAPSWGADDLEGRRHTLQQYRGQVVVLDFWFRGCLWCYKQAPQINAVAAHFEKVRAPVTFLNVTTDDADDARAVRDKLQLHGPVLLNKDAATTFPLDGFPRLIVLDQEGIVRGYFPGYSKERDTELTSFVESLLANKGMATPAANTPK